jgi:hypothetical protein
VRRLVCCVALLSLAASLHASVPANSSARFEGAGQFARQPVFDRSRPGLILTAAPADVSFYEEFYPRTSVRHEQPAKTSVLHWFGSLIKKAVRR